MTWTTEFVLPETRLVRKRLSNLSQRREAKIWREGALSEHNRLSVEPEAAKTKSEKHATRERRGRGTKSVYSDLEAI